MVAENWVRFPYLALAVWPLFFVSHARRGETRMDVGCVWRCVQVMGIVSALYKWRRSGFSVEVVVNLLGFPPGDSMSGSKGAGHLACVDKTKINL